MNLKLHADSRAVVLTAALAIAALTTACGWSNSPRATLPQSNGVAPMAGPERELARVTVDPHLHPTPVNFHAHGTPVQGAPPAHNQMLGGPSQTSCPGVSQCLTYHGGPVLFNTGNINVYVNPDQTGGAFPNNCTTMLCPPAQWGFPGGFEGRYSHSSMNHIMDQYEVPSGPNRDDRWPYLGYITLIDPTIQADSSHAHQANDSTFTAELTAAKAAVGLMGDRYMYHLFYRQGQWWCSNQLGGNCYSPGSNDGSFRFCGFHGFQTIAASDTLFSVEGYQHIGPSCGTPSGDLASDTASILSHEMTEAYTDPHLDAWYNSSGNEIGDICRSTYSTITMNPNSVAYNIQEEWINSLSACAYGP